LRLAGTKQDRRDKTRTKPKEDKPTTSKH